MDLRAARVGDRAFIKQLLMSNGLHVEDILEEAPKFFVASEGAVAIGIAGLETCGRHGLLRSIAVFESLRRRGYGQALVRKMIEQAASHGIRELYLLTLTAEPFFARLGFERIDRTQAPESIQRTREFAQLCPASAICMRLAIQPGRLPKLNNAKNGDRHSFPETSGRER